MYPPQNNKAAQMEVQPSLDAQPVAKQPTAQKGMSLRPDTGASKQEGETMRLRGGCPGRLCGLPILPCACDICIIPIPCC